MQGAGTPSEHEGMGWGGEGTRDMSLLSERELTRRIRELRPLSETARALIEIAEDPDHDRASIVRIIEKDGPLTARALRMVHSSALAPPAPIDSLEQVVGYLGERILVAAALLDSTGEWMSVELGPYGTGPSGLWAKGLRGAIASRLLALTGHAVPPAAAYTAALLRDVGMAVLAPVMGPRASKLQEMLREDPKLGWVEAERQLLGIDHAEIGRRIARSFHLSAGLEAAIHYHHAPEAAPEEHQDLVRLVHRADAICTMLGGDPVRGLLDYRVDEETAAWLGLPLEALAKLLNRTLDEFEHSYAALAL